MALLDEELGRLQVQVIHVASLMVLMVVIKVLMDPDTDIWIGKS